MVALDLTLAIINNKRLDCYYNPKRKRITINQLIEINIRRHPGGSIDHSNNFF